MRSKIRRDICLPSRNSYVGYCRKQAASFLPDHPKRRSATRNDKASSRGDNKPNWKTLHCPSQSSFRFSPRSKDTAQLVKDHRRQAMRTIDQSHLSLVTRLLVHLSGLLPCPPTYPRSTPLLHRARRGALPVRRVDCWLSPSYLKSSIQVLLSLCLS